MYKITHRSAHTMIWLSSVLASVSSRRSFVWPVLAVMMLLTANVSPAHAQTSAVVTGGPSGAVAVGSSATYSVTFSFTTLTYAVGFDLVTDGALDQHITTLFGNTVTYGTGFAEYTLNTQGCGDYLHDTYAGPGNPYGVPTSCSITVTFSPKVAGARPGAVVLKGSYTSTIPNVDAAPPLAFAFLNGTATGPQAVFASGISSSLLTGLTTASAVAVDGGGNIYYTDQGAKTLSKLTFGSTTPTVLVSNINVPTGVAVDGVGNVYYGAYSDNKVYKIPYDGSATTSISVSNPDVGMAVDINGNVYVAGLHSVSKIAVNTTTATNVATVGTDAIPAVAVDASGNVFFTDFTSNKVYEVASGTTTPVALSTVDGGGINELNGPRGIVVDGGGNLYVANQTSQKVLRLANGTWTQTVVTSGFGYSGLAIDGSGALYTPVGTTITKDDRSGTSLTYTPVVLGTPSAQQAITLENDGTGSLSISSFTIGTSNADTAGAATTCNTTSVLNPGKQCVLGVRFSPTQATTTSGTVTITDNSLNNPSSTQLIQLTGSTANDPQTITFVQPSAAAPNTTVALTGTASSGLPVSYSIMSGPATISADGTTVTYTGLGTVVIKATQSGNTNYAAATSVNSTVQVIAVPVITFTPPSTGIVGTTITLSASSNQSATPITFSIVSGTATLVGAQLTFTASGTVVLAASQAGTANYPSGQAQATIQVYKPQSITFTPTTPVAPGTSTVLSASATSGLPITFALVSGPATIVNNSGTYTITYNAVGTVIIKASQAGNGTWAAASDVQGTVAVVARPVITFAPTTPVTLGSSATLTATSTQNGSPVIFSIVGGTATLSGASITYTYAEPVVIEADQAGTANYPAALPVRVTVYVTGTAATTSLIATSSGTPVSSATPGTAITLTATVSTGASHPAQGEVTFCDAPSISACTFLHLLGTAQLRSGANAGTAVFQVVPGIGSHNYFAIFGPSAVYARSTSTVVPVSISGNNTSTVISQSGSAGNYTLTGTVTSSLGASPTGTVNFLDESNSYASLGSTSLVAGDSTTSFDYGSHPSVTGAPAAILAVDLDGDGIPDLVTANAYVNTISVLKGNGDGIFAPLSSPPVGNYPTGIASGDFNGDGIPDLAVANQGDSTVTILLGNGAGTFNSSTVYAGGYEITLTVGDFNGDGIADLAVAGYSSVTILLGHGDGTFTTGQTFAIGFPVNIVTGDFNGDGITDLAVGSAVYLGHGDGSFTQSAGLSCAGPVAVGDFNGDNIADVAVSSTTSVCVFQGNGDGTFTASANVPSVRGQYAITAGDFNGDGIADLVVEGFTPQNYVGTTVLLGKGDGTFPTVTTTPLRSVSYDYAAGLAVGDFNKDGLSDYAAVLYSQYDGPPYDDYSTVFLSSVSSTATATVTGINPIGTGTHNVAAFYSGQGIYTPSVSSTTPLAATNLLSNTIIFPQPTTPVTTGSTAVLGATSTSGTVIYTITAGTATLSGSNITYTTAGTVQITATSPSTTTYAAATPVSVTVTVSFAQAYFSWVPSTLSIYSGTALGTSVLDATFSVPGTIGYTTALQPSGSPVTALPTTILSAGSYLLSATATPTSSGYAVNTESLPFTVQNMNVFLANSVGTVSSFFNVGTVQSSATAGGGIGAAVDSNGNVWSISSDGNGIQKFTDYGAVAASYNSSGISGAKALALDGSNNVWVANGNGNITVVANTGVALYTLPGSTTSAASSVSVDRSGNVWLSNPTTNTVDEIIGGAAPVNPLSIAVTLGNPAARP